MEQKLLKKVSVFQIIAFELEHANSHNLEQELLSGVNVLTNTPKISPKTRGDIFQINFPKNDKKTR